MLDFCIWRIWIINKKIKHERERTTKKQKGQKNIKEKRRPLHPGLKPKPPVRQKKMNTTTELTDKLTTLCAITY